MIRIGPSDEQEWVYLLWFTLFKVSIVVSSTVSVDGSFRVELFIALTIGGIGTIAPDLFALCIEGGTYAVKAITFDGEMFSVSQTLNIGLDNCCSAHSPVKAPEELVPHGFPFFLCTSCGQSPLSPVHDSAKSHSFVSGRHTAPADFS